MIMTLAIAYLITRNNSPWKPMVKRPQSLIIKTYFQIWWLKIKLYPWQ
jgi:hypothetical protein